MNTPLVPFQAGSPIKVSGPTKFGKTYWTHKLWFLAQLNLERPIGHINY